MSYTKGPWTVRYGSIAPAICSAEGIGQLACLTVYDRPTQSANARLIAAAPELVDMVHELLAQLEAFQILNGLDPENHEDVKKARNLIDRITGDDRHAIS